MNKLTPQVEGNKLIAEFEQRKFFGKYTIDHYGEGTFNELPEMKYHSSWDWLMPVVERIKSLWDAEFLDLQLLIEDSDASRISHLLVWADIDSVYEAVIEFIKWYNSQNK